MRFLLESFFSQSWFLIVILIVAMGLLLLTSFTRRKKEESYRNDLAEKIVKGAKIKTYSGLYGTVEGIRNTTDGKIVLISTGEGNKVSYQELHINAIYGLDESEEVVLNADGVEVPASELNKQEEVTAETQDENKDATEIKEEKIETKKKTKKDKE